MVALSDGDSSGSDGMECLVTAVVVLMVGLKEWLGLMTVINCVHWVMVVVSVIMALTTLIALTYVYAATLYFSYVH